MKLEKILESLNSLEKNSFIKVIDGIIGNKPQNLKAIEKIISETDNSGLKNLDSKIISKIFNLVEVEFLKIIKSEFIETTSQLDIIGDIVMRDGNCIMKQDWFARLYEIEIKKISAKIKQLKIEIEDPKSEISEQRKRDYKIYRTCLNTAYYNDLTNNREAKITDDEQTILHTLANELELSQEEMKLINYMIIPVVKNEIDTVINDLKNLGIVFHSKKANTVLVADEMVVLLRKIRGKEIADKYFRRILRTLREPQINLICKKYNIDRKLTLEEKIKEIIKGGVSLTSVLVKDIHKDGISLTDKKTFLNELWSIVAMSDESLKGSTIEDKIENIINHFDHLEKDDKIGISYDGYEKLLSELGESLPILNSRVRSEFEIQDENVLKGNLLLDYNIKPLDVIDLIKDEEIQVFCKEKGIKTRGNNAQNILDAYKDSENLFLENYISIGFRDLGALKENGLLIKEIDLGLKFEELTKSIFSQLGFDVDEKLKADFNTKNDKIDILLNLGNNELILVECKTVKESGYNKFSSVSRQMNAYTKLAAANGYSTIKSLLIAPDFSDEFINETELEYDLNLSLITSSTLLNILEAFKASKKHKQFPYKLLMRDVLIDADRIIKAIGR